MGKNHHNQQYKPGNRLRDFKEVLYLFNRVQENIPKTDDKSFHYGIVGGMAVQIYLQEFLEETNDEETKGVLERFKRSSLDMDSMTDKIFREALMKTKQERELRGYLEILDKPFYLDLNQSKHSLKVQLIEDEGRLKQNQFETRELYKDKKTNRGQKVVVSRLEHLIPFKISRYNPENRKLDHFDVISLIPIVYEKMKKNEFSMTEMYENISNHYPINSVCGKNLLKFFDESIKNLNKLRPNERPTFYRKLYLQIESDLKEYT